MNARTTLSFLPAACVLIVAGGGWWHLRNRGNDARKELAAMTIQHEEVKISALSSEAMEDMESLQKKLDALEADILEKETSITQTRAEIERVIARTPVAPDEMTSSFGKIGDMGRETGSLIRLLVASSDAASDGKKLHELTEEEAMEFQASFMKLLAWVPVIGEMESTPSEFAQFQAAAFREFYELDDATSAQLESVVSDHFRKIAADGWSVLDRPTEEGEGADAWKAGRSAALAALMVDLRPLLPEREPIIERGIFPSLLNVGAGLETQTYKTPDGKSATSMGLPDWPAPPWLVK